MPNNKKVSKSAYSKQLKLRRNSSGAVIRNYENLAGILQCDPALQNKIRLNDLDGRIHIAANVPWSIAQTRIDADNTAFYTDFDEAQLCLYIDEHIGWCSKEMLNTACKAIAAENSYNPRIDYFDSLIWDKIPRLEKLFIDYLGADDDQYLNDLAGDRRWFPIKCSDKKKKDASELTDNEVSQLWAEAVSYYKEDFSLEFPESIRETAVKIRNEFSEIEDEAQQIRDYINGLSRDRICSEEILENCLHMAITPTNKRRVNSILKNKLGL